MTDKLEKVVSGAWVGFARDGDPGWTPYTDERKGTMVFDRHSRLRLNYDRELMETIHRLTPPMSMDGLAIMMLENAVNEQGGDWMY